MRIMKTTKLWSRFAEVSGLILTVGLLLNSTPDFAQVSVVPGANPIASPTPSPTPVPQPPLVSPLFSNNMVLQRGMADPIWGWMPTGTRVSIDVNGSGIAKHMTAVSDASGKWTAKLPKLPVGGPYEIKIDAGSGNTADFTNVLCGDVWLCTGQSNMQFGIGNADGGKDEIKNANYPQIRLFCVNKVTASATPQQTAASVGWDVATPDTLQKDGTWNGFSAVGWYFGKGLYADQKVPIGLLASFVGGTPAEAWTSANALQKSMPEIAATIPDQITQNIANRRRNTAVPSVLFNGMINPLIPYGVKGAIWYQGESNEGRGYAYRTLLPTMISDWRTRWNEGNFPFLIVQIAGWQPQTDAGDSSSAEVRDAEDLVSHTLPNCGIATAVDIGDPQNIHPTNKAEVGRRLDLVARALVYHEKVIYSGPTYKAMVINGSQITINFDNVIGGLIETAPGPIVGFAIAGADHKWYWADAVISNKYSVIVSSPNVPQPIAVRYGWSNYLALNLEGNAGLPVMPFRTDNWKLWSQP